VAVRTLLLAARPHLDDPAAMVAALGDPALGRQTGLLAQLAARHTPVLLGGGTDTAAAALLAARLVPGAQRWWIAGSAPVETAGLAALTSLGVTPLLDLGLRTGGADVAVAVLRTGLEQLGA
jgi:nicotinate-nucleotide--dimethylbenzimidazole phosphoribosyltransferase